MIYVLFLFCVFSTRYDTFSNCILFPFDFLDCNICICCTSLSHSHSICARVLARSECVCLLRDVVCNLCSHATVQMRESRFVTNLSFAFLLILFCLLVRRYVCVCDQTLLLLLSLGRNDAKCEAQIIIPLKNQQTNLN